MPSLGFKDQFETPVVAGTKPHTIRARRKNKIKVGDRLYFYVRMRQPSCRKFGEATVEKIERIRIYSVRTKRNGGSTIHRVYIGSKKLTPDEIFNLALADGFNVTCPVSSFFKFFSDTHGPRFEGDLIHWKDFQPFPPAVCPECKCKPPGHKLDCVSSNERARVYQRELAFKYANRNRRK